MYSIPRSALTNEQVDYVNQRAVNDQISKSAVLRQAIAKFLAVPVEIQRAYLDREYDESHLFVNVYLTPEQYEHFDQAIQKLGSTRSKMVRAALQHAMTRNGG